MSEVQSNVAPSLVIRRTYAAPPERVYEAWTDPQLARRFLCPKDVTVPEIDMDVRVGGAYRIVMLMADGERMIVGGVYRDVVPSERLSMTWRWEEDDPRDERDTLLTLEFLAHGEGTELVLTHENLKSAESRDNHHGGWSSVLEKLDRVV